MKLVEPPGATLAPGAEVTVKPAGTLSELTSMVSVCEPTLLIVNTRLRCTFSRVLPNDSCPAVLTRALPAESLTAAIGAAGQ